MRRRLILAALAAPALAQPFNRPLRLLVGFPPGGVSDLVARAIAEKLELGQPVVVENRPGAGGNLAAEAVARAAPDGYTLLNGQNSTLAINPALYRSLPFDTARDFRAVIGTVAGTSVLVAHPNGPASLDAVLAARPGSLAYASFGAGSLAHLNGAMLADAAGIALLHVPYRGAAPALADVLGGQVPMMFDLLATTRPHIEAGRLRALAVVSPERLPELPGVPALAERFRGFDGRGWQALMVPAATPDAVVARLHEAARAALSDPGVVARMAGFGLTITGWDGPAVMAALAADAARYGRIIRTAGITPD